MSLKPTHASLWLSGGENSYFRFYPSEDAFTQFIAIG